MGRAPVNTAHNAPPRVAVVTVNYNSGHHLTSFLESTPSASRSPLELVVVDNASSDGPAAQQSAEAVGGTFLQLDENLGYGGAVNRAVGQLPPSVEWVLVSNPDVVLSAGVVDALVAAADADPRVGAVGPAVLERDGTVYPSARRVPSLRTGLGHAVFANIWPGNPWTRAYHDDDSHDHARTAGWLSGSCLLVRRSLFDDLGGFDERFFMYFEDVDLGHRIGRTGHVNLYLPEVSVVHVGAHSTRSSSDRMRREHHRSAYRFLAGKYDAWYLFPLRAVLAVALTARSRLGPRGER